MLICEVMFDFVKEGLVVVVCNKGFCVIEFVDSEFDEMLDIW